MVQWLELVLLLRRTPRFCFQHPHGASQSPVILVPSLLTLVLLEVPVCTTATLKGLSKGMGYDGSGVFILYLSVHLCM